jgi:hypothetical protein
MRSAATLKLYARLRLLSDNCVVLDIRAGHTARIHGMDGWAHLCKERKGKPPVSGHSPSAQLRNNTGPFLITSVTLAG